MAQGSEKRFTRICEDCGKVMLVPGRCTKRCDACKKRHREADERARREQKRAQAIRAKAEKSKNREALRADMAAADAAGMSYGKWRIQQMMQAQKGI